MSAGNTPNAPASQAARSETLQRIRAALGRDGAGAGAPLDPAPQPDGYRRVETAPRAAIVEQFVERVADYKARVRRVGGDGLPRAIADACRARGVRRLAIPADLPPAWTEALAEVELLRDAPDAPLSAAQLDACDGALTGCALGVAQTGTIALDAGATQGRRILTLLPDYHLCVIREEQIVGLVPEAITALAPAVVEGRRPVTFISGPSATSDIELSRVEGVHGPRTLDVLIVMEYEAPGE